jgi:hypothetical protein
MSEKEISPTNIVDSAEEKLLKKFPGKSVGIRYRNIPAYEWNGAGSEKGGSCDYFRFGRIIFADSNGLQNGERLAISVGRREGERDSSFPIILNNDESLSIPYNPKMYGVLRVIVPEYFAEQILKKQKNKGGSFDYAINKFLKREYMGYGGISLFAFDGEVNGLRRGFFVKRRPPLDGENLTSLLEEFHVDDANGLTDKLLEPRNFGQFDRLENLSVNMYMNREHIEYLVEMMNK